MQLESQARQVGQSLLQHGRWLCTAESCTGGGLAHIITAIDGSSKWFERGFVTYSNLAKQQLLGVQEFSLETHGAVSEIVAKEMAQGAVAHSAADIGIAITGIAGPSGGSADKPVGTVYIATHTKAGNTRCEHFLFSGDRQEVRQQSIAQALRMLMDVINA